jgi:adenosylcobinamide-GDP ribazoletransferase
MGDAVRLALGTLTIVRVPPPREVTRLVAGRAMLLAPLVGALLGLVAAIVLDVVRIMTGAHRPSTTVDLLASSLALVTLAWLTRGLHLDGLADTADGLGVKGDDADVRARRLAVMRAPDVGAFGVATLVLTLLVQVAALTECTVSGFGTVSLVVAATTGRLGILWCCTPSTASARPDGLGAAVAGSVRTGAALAATCALLGVAAGLGMLDDDRGPRVSALLVVAVVLGVMTSLLVRRRASTRFGGITGDVLGAVVELATTVVLVVVALGAGLV